MNGGPATRRRLWAGRALALIGVILLAVNLRTAVGALSPIARVIEGDIPLDDASLGVLGMLPPFAFAVSAFAASRARRLGPEGLVTVALVAALAGHVVRAFAGSFAVLAGGSLLVFIAMGVGNVMLPPLVKKYFPDRIGLLTAVYTTVNAVGMALPPLIAFPVAIRYGWRSSLLIWAVVAFIGLVPWVVQLIRAREHEASPAMASRTAVRGAERAESPGRLWRSRIAWGLAIMFAVVSLHVYTMFAWLPELMIQWGRQAPVVAGGLLALYSALGLPLGMVVPLVAERMAQPARLVYFGAACMVLGYAGIVSSPGAVPWLWVVLLRLGSVMFPLCLVMINLRSRTPAGSARLSTFVQGVGYTIAAIGPLLVGALHAASSSWLPPLLVLVATVAAVVVVPSMLRSGTFVEDETTQRITSREERE
ncbi:MFS transporter [Microbacterium kribbense]|uniref:MFS transporter n=1 Tax=Microbacterium kribbense TaxID=433645 RepID=A0ABP7G8I5_9MICO